MQTGFSNFFFFSTLSPCISSSAVIIHFINMSLRKISFQSTSRSLTYLDWPYDFHTLLGSNTSGEKSPKPTHAFDSESNTYGPKTKLWQKQHHDYHIFTRVKLQNYLPKWNRVSAVPAVSCFFHLKILTVLVCKNSEPDIQTAAIWLHTILAQFPQAVQKHQLYFTFLVQVQA